MTAETPPVGLDLPTGTVEEAREWVGRTSETRFADEPVNGPMIRLYASVLENGNPAYWDERFADRVWGGIPAPPGMLLTWRMPPLWTPAGEEPTAPIYGLDVPLPAAKDQLLFVESDVSVDRPAYVGERLNWRATILDVTEEKETSLGTGHFVTSETTIRAGDGDRVAMSTSTIFRHERPADSPEADAPFARGRRAVEAADPPSRDRYDSRPPEAITEGGTLPGFEFPVPYERVIRNVAATREFIQPGLHDPEFARSQGNKTVFLNAIAIEGLLDRLVTDWSGPEWRVVERSMRTLRSAVAGACLVADGEVTAVEDGTVTVEATIDDRGGDPVCEGRVRIKRVSNG